MGGGGHAWSEHREGHWPFAEALFPHHRRAAEPGGLRDLLAARVPEAQGGSSARARSQGMGLGLNVKGGTVPCATKAPAGPGVRRLGVVAEIATIVQEFQDLGQLRNTR